ncbi:uncharacterized protein NFIA_083460 [Aspergillus fischeri NRRL 181]|uniref:Uncharacterized protein n=1 Tax=Neosartorya fischeri (strain ATCC 1020 / DSM 3700 / CBS 544.65 / FGSC A1164 / JCM 1740 / NRRL 181 / WB 181) TaxID=331117 RepID=A1DG88_NEOFI|nr:uncharacterized protein NFIA_083460 [Aspergillus fischeri NRRL 181]EAW18395.1 predicted protein [Aspergillus fischeri NRRL 181]
MFILLLESQLIILDFDSCSVMIINGCTMCD